MAYTFQLVAPDGTGAVNRGCMDWAVTPSGRFGLIDGREAFDQRLSKMIIQRLDSKGLIPLFGSRFKAMLGNKYRTSTLSQVASAELYQVQQHLLLMQKKGLTDDQTLVSFKSVEVHLVSERMFVMNVKVQTKDTVADTSVLLGS